MKITSRSSQGFTLIEILIVLAIMAILLGIGSVALINQRSAKQLNTITDSIAAKLEEAKTNAMAGKNGQNYGVTFTPSSYILWYGTSYSSSDPNNIEYPINDSFTLDSTLSGDSVRFSRITGTPNTSGTTTITHNQNASTIDSIYIGPLGDISVIK